MYDKAPIDIKNYRILESLNSEIDKVSKLIKDGIVAPSMPEYCSPLLLAPKQKPLPNINEKGWSLIVDYRQVNKKLLAHKFLLQD